MDALQSRRRAAEHPSRRDFLERLPASHKQVQEAVGPSLSKFVKLCNLFYNCVSGRCRSGGSLRRSGAFTRSSAGAERCQWLPVVVLGCGAAVWCCGATVWGDGAAVWCYAGVPGCCCGVRAVVPEVWCRVQCYAMRVVFFKKTFK